MAHVISRGELTPRSSPPHSPSKSSARAGRHEPVASPTRLADLTADRRRLCSTQTGPTVVRSAHASSPPGRPSLAPPPRRTFDGPLPSRRGPSRSDRGRCTDLTTSHPPRHTAHHPTTTAQLQPLFPLLPALDPAPCRQSSTSTTVLVARTSGPARIRNRVTGAGVELMRSDDGDVGDMIGRGGGGRRRR